MTSATEELDASSDDDFYDNFEKYKQKHKALNNDRDRLIIKRECQNGELKKRNMLIDKPKITEDDDDIIDVKDDLQCSSYTKEDRFLNIALDLDAEFAEFVSSKPPPRKLLKPSVGAEHPGEVAKYSDNLRSLLRETRSTLDVVEQRERTTATLSEVEKVEHEMSEILSNPVNFKKRCTLNLRNLANGQSFIERFDMDKPFKNMMQKCAERLNMDADNIVFMGRDRRFYPGDTPLSVGLNEENVHEIDVFQNSDTRGCTISVKWLLRGKKPIVANVFLKKKFSELKAEFCADNQLDIAKTDFIFDSEKLDDNETPESLDLEDGDCIDVYVKD